MRRRTLIALAVATCAAVSCTSTNRAVRSAPPAAVAVAAGTWYVVDPAGATRGFIAVSGEVVVYDLPGIGAGSTAPGSSQGGAAVAAAHLPLADGRELFLARGRGPVPGTSRDAVVFGDYLHIDVYAAPGQAKPLGAVRVWSEASLGAAELAARLAQPRSTAVAAPVSPPAIAPAPRAPEARDAAFLAEARALSERASAWATSLYAGAESGRHASELRASWRMLGDAMRQDAQLALERARRAPGESADLLARVDRERGDFTRFNGCVERWLSQRP